MVSGGGAFYDLNLDFGCCFGDLLPNPPVVVPPAITSLSEILLQKSNYRTLLINGSTSGARFYAHNTEQDNGDAHTEIRYKSVYIYAYILRVALGRNVDAGVHVCDHLHVYSCGAGTNPWWVSISCTSAKVASCSVSLSAFL